MRVQKGAAAAAGELKPADDAWRKRRSSAAATSVWLQTEEVATACLAQMPSVTKGISLVHAFHRLSCIFSISLMRFRTSRKANLSQKGRFLNFPGQLASVLIGRLFEAASSFFFFFLVEKLPF